MDIEHALIWYSDEVKIGFSQVGGIEGAKMAKRRIFSSRQEVQIIDKDQLPSFIFRVPGIVLKTNGEQVVFKLMASREGNVEEKARHLLKLTRTAEGKEREVKVGKTNMRTIRLGLLRALRYSKKK